MPILQMGKLRLGKVTSCPGSGPSLSTPSVQPSPPPLPFCLPPTFSFSASMFPLETRPLATADSVTLWDQQSPQVKCHMRWKGSREDLFILFIITSSMH